jgi:hypothetical protein
MWRGSVRAGNVRKGKGCTGNVGKRERNHFIYTEFKPHYLFRLPYYLASVGIIFLSIISHGAESAGDSP